ncbi:MAG TPA: hypothetical protein PLF60_02610 [Bacillota bacterium]|nr:hypothetical protein [Bacillota bacterium]
MVRFLLQGRPLLAAVLTLTVLVAIVFIGRHIGHRCLGTSLNFQDDQDNQAGEAGTSTVAGVASVPDCLTPQQIAFLIEDELAWLMDCRLPNGAFIQSPEGNTVIPYFANLAARTLVARYPGAVRDYILWYLASLNKPDRWGLSGTIYDYRVMYASGSSPANHGQYMEIMMIPTANYDSADSYAATFLSLVADYYFITGDKELIRSHLDDLSLVANVVLELQDEDGLVFVKPGSWTKYLMDNAENYRGLLDWSQVLLEEGYIQEANHLKHAAARIKEGIFDVLYDPETGAFAWSVSPIWKRFPREGRWYPDGVSQLYLLTCGLIAPDDPVAHTIWHAFVKTFPEWQAGVNKDKFPWTSVAVASFMMGDRDKALEFVGWADREYLLNGRPYPWYILESANLVTLLELVASSAPTK